MTFIVSIVGNIGAGKSTLLKALQEHYPLIEEGVDEWISDYGFNWLQAFYQEPKRWTFSFQMRVLKTLREIRERISKMPMEVVMTERSPLDSRHVFFEYHKTQGYINDAEYQLYHTFWQQTAWKPDLIIYVDTTPEICHQRAQERGRDEEATLPLKFYQDMDEQYSNLINHVGAIPFYRVGNSTEGLVAEKVATIQKVIEKYRPHE